MGDPTLLFTTAGMVQFKPYYSATGDVPYTRAASVQKCLRLTDLENVGLTPRHDTFFEMLGNFSFGPREQGRLLQGGGDRLRLGVRDEGAGPAAGAHLRLGLRRRGQAAARRRGRSRCGRRSGCRRAASSRSGARTTSGARRAARGACGPSSEIYFDLGEQRPDYLPEGAFWGEAPGDDGDRFMEFWNLVFPQFDAQADGTLEPLPRPGIDTGMGLERLSLILQGKSTIFETDVFAPLVDEVLAPVGAPRRRAWPRCATRASSPTTCARSPSRSPRARCPATRARATCCAACCAAR